MYGFLYLTFLNVLLLSFTKVQSKKKSIAKDSLGKSNEGTLDSEFAVSALKL